MPDPFADYHAGRIDFAKFEQLTRHMWARFARIQLRRWRAPAYVTEQDLIQEMLVAVFAFTLKWDASHAVPVRRYVTWNAIDKARKWLHKQRRAGHEGGRGSSRFDLPVSSLMAEGVDERGDLLDRIAPPVEPSQESAAVYAQARRQYAGLSAVIHELERTGSVEAAAAKAVGHERSRNGLGVESVDEAREKVCCMIDMITEQVTL